MDFKKLGQFLKDEGQPAFRLKQIQKAVFEDALIDFNDMTSLPKDLRDVLKDEFRILPFFAMPTGRQAKNILVSKNKDSYKALLELEDGRVIETVLLNMSEGSWSVCVSSQAGCAMRCSFCATGASGFFRNLTSSEIWGQVLFWKAYIKEHKINGHAYRQAGKISNVVYMGMGEPFNNLENVFESVRVLTDPQMLGIGQRSVSISTCGVVPGIERFAQEFPQVNLAISLHAPSDELRNQLMPVNQAYNLKALAQGLKDYFKKANRKVFIEYILLDGVNDSLENANDLVSYLAGIGNRQLLHVNLIVFNQVQGSKLNPSSRNQAERFKNFLIKNKFNATIRKSLGQDIEGACGQLAGQKPATR